MEKTGQPGRKAYSPLARAAAIALLYFVVAGLWIAFSDMLLARAVDDPELLTRLQTLKGGFFVLVTAILLFFLVLVSGRHLLKAHREAMQASRDALTGLAGWYRLQDLLGRLVGQSREQNTPMAVIVLDLDRLRRVNEAFGISTGDALLMQVADRLRGLRRNNLVLARPGSDHFVVLVAPPCDRDEAVKVASEILALLEAPYQVAGESLEVHFRAGIAVYPDDGREEQELLRAAETAVFEARREGSSLAHYRQKGRESRERYILENSLRGALARGEFRVYFQPIVDLGDGRILGGEALLRWQHPELGLVSPGHFIPLLEQSGQILEVGQWVLEEATMQAAGWPKPHGESIGVSVNVSRLQLGDPSFVDHVRRVVSDSGLAVGRLVLEVTESLAMRNPAETMARLQDIRSAGVGVAMDDFGTGYSSLAYLKRYPLDFIKIDRLFVQGIPADRENDLLMETIVDMSRRLGRETVAEGIETAEEARRLAEIGCMRGQGFLFSPAVPPERFHELLSTGGRFNLPSPGGSGQLSDVSGQSDG